MNWADYVVIALVLLSCIYGLARGLLRELISLITWVTAVLLAWNFADSLAPHLGGALADSAVRAWAARVLIFGAVMLFGTGVGALVHHYVRLSIFSGLDRLLGLVFGLLRGFVAIGLLVMLCHAVRLADEPWYRGAALAPYAESAANVLRALVGERIIHFSRSGDA